MRLILLLLSSIIIGLGCSGFVPDKYLNLYACESAKNFCDEKRSDSLAAKLGYIIFGVYCADLSTHRATLYKYNMLGNTNTLLVDSTDSYFLNNEQLIFNTSIANKAKMDIAQSIVRQIPNQLLVTTKSTETFGCPDCFDGCGIYFEFWKLENEGKPLKKFYIDYNTSKLPEEIKTFAEYLKKVIRQLKA